MWEATIESQTEEERIVFDVSSAGILHIVNFQYDKGGVPAASLLLPPPSRVLSTFSLQLLHGWYALFNVFPLPLSHSQEFKVFNTSPLNEYKKRFCMKPKCAASESENSQCWGGVMRINGEAPWLLRNSSMTWLPGYHKQTLQRGSGTV